MSRGQLARTPENFPRMKHRAAGRLARKKVATVPTLFDAIAEAGRKIARAFGAFIGALTPPPTQADFVLVDGPRLPPMTMLVSPQRQAEICNIRARSYELAVQRGHIRRYA